MDSYTERRWSVSVPCLVLAGGLGERLKVLSDDTPKPMMPVAGRPFIEYVILQLRDQGFDDIVLCTGYGADQIEDYFDDGTRWDVSIRYSRETHALGTGGALQQAARKVHAPYLLALNGDSILDGDFRALIALHKRQEAAVTMGLANVADASRFGRVETGADGRITRFTEKGAGGPGSINGGVYVLNREVLEAIPPERVSLEQEVIPGLMAAGAGLFAKSFPGFFVDMGVPGDYLHLCAQPERLEQWLVKEAVC